MKRNKFRKTVFLQILAVIIATLLFIQSSIAFASTLETRSLLLSDWRQDFEPCDLLPLGGTISTKSEDVCVGQFASEPGEKIVQIQTNTMKAQTEILCNNLHQPSDFGVFMNDVKFGDCGVQEEIAYQGKPAPGYTGWQIRYFYQGINVRVATSEDYPANKSWIYDTAEAIETKISNISGETVETAAQEEPVEMPPSNKTEDVPTENKSEVRKTKEECTQMQQEVADMADNAPNFNVADLKLGVIAEVVSAPEIGPAIQEYCGGGEGALIDGSQIKIGDCIKNGDGLLIKMKDQETDDSYGTVFELGKDTQICFDEFWITEGPRIRSVSDLIGGALHAITKGWKNGSIFSVKAGTTVLGGRGTEFIVQNFAEDDVVFIQVLEGHVDVTTEDNGESISLTDNQDVVISKGDIVVIADLRQDLWDEAMEENSFANIDIDAPKNEKNTTTTELIENDNIYEPAYPSNSSNLSIILVVAILGTIIVVLAAIIIILMRKKNRNKRGEG